VRREKALDFSGCKLHPQTGSPHAMAIEVGFLSNEQPNLDFPAGSRAAPVPLPGMSLLA